MADGFKIADAFVQVVAKLDDSEVQRAANRAGDAAGARLTESLGRAGTTGGTSFGRSFSSSAEGRIRDSRGRFASVFNGIGDGVGKSSGGKAGAGFGNTFLGGMTGIAGKAGGMLASGISSVASSGIHVQAGIVGAVAVAAPLAGSVLAAGLTAGVAGAAIGIGIAASVRQPAVRAAFSDLKADAGSILGNIGREWQPTMLSVIGNVRGDMRSIGASLQAALAPAKGYVQPLVDGFTGLVRNIMPGFSSLIAKAGPVIGALKDGFLEIGDALNDVFMDLSGSTNEAAGGLQFMLYMVADLARAGGAVISWLAKAHATTIDWAVSFLGFLSKIPGVGDMFKGWQDDLKIVQATADGTGAAMVQAGSSVQRYGAAASEASQRSESMAARQRILNGTMADGANEAGDLKAAMDALNGAAQSAEEAEIGFRESVKQATDAIKDNGRTTDMNTEKGRANRSVLLELARAGQTRAQAQYDQTSATKGTSAAEAAAAKAYANSRNQLIQTAQRMGMTKSQARAYADQIMAIPKSWTTNVKANTGGARSAISNLRAYLKSIPDETVNIAMRITGNTNVSASAAAIRKQYGMSKGGPVVGPGRKGVDSVIRILAPGEHVLTDKEVDAAGGHGAVESLRKSLRGGTGGGGNARKPGNAPVPGRAGSGSPLKLPSFPGTPMPKGGQIGTPTKVVGRPITRDELDKLPFPKPPAGGGGGGGYGGGSVEITNINIETVTLDPAGIRTVQQLVELLQTINTVARSSRARAAAAPGV